MVTSRKVIVIFSVAAIGAICGLVLTSGIVSAVDIFVGPGEIYTTIQPAVTAASPFDTIIVRDGTYNENIDATVNSVTIRSENSSANCVVNASDQNDHVFNVTANWVNISGFAMHNATEANKAGIYLNNVDHCTLSENNASNNGVGIWLDFSSNNTLTGNNVSNNNTYGIFLFSSSNDNTITNNTANSNNDFGFFLDSSSNNTLTGNNASNNLYGIFLDSSSNNTLTGNNASNNNNSGIYLHVSNNNLINNNYFNNTNNAWDDGTNIWNISKTSGTNIIGGSWLGGNYWLDYEGEDTDTPPDGLGDTPYEIPGGTNKDYLPLVVAPHIFDTGIGDYPSIPGIHNGTITPFYDINVSILYTYPCAGTGGHTEYVKIWTSTDWNITATWDGYKGDWHSIAFDKQFTLYANETYNYTIRTGSYPQIIHESSWNATGGVITCTEFMNINGQRHENWIPVIRLA